MMNTLGFDGLSPLKSSGCCCSCSCWACRSTCAELVEARLLSLSKHLCWACRSTCAELVEALVLSSSKHLCWACRSTCAELVEALVLSLPKRWSFSQRKASSAMEHTSIRQSKVSAPCYVRLISFYLLWRAINNKKCFSMDYSSLEICLYSSKNRKKASLSTTLYT